MRSRLETECWVAYVLACVVRRLEGVLPSLEAGILGFRVSRHTFRVGWKSSCPVWESLHRTVYVPAYATRRIRFRRAASRWGSTSHVCHGMRNVRETHRPEPLIGFPPPPVTLRNTPVRHGHPMIMNPNDLRQRNPAGDIHVITHRVHAACYDACRDAATVDRRRDIRQRNCGISFAALRLFCDVPCACVHAYHNGPLLKIGKPTGLRTSADVYKSTGRFSVVPQRCDARDTRIARLDDNEILAAAECVRVCCLGFHSDTLRADSGKPVPVHT